MNKEEFIKKYNAEKIFSFCPKFYYDIADTDKELYSYVFPSAEHRKIELFVYLNTIAVAENRYGNVIWHYKNTNTEEHYIEAVVIAKNIFLEGTNV